MRRTVKATCTANLPDLHKTPKLPLKLEGKGVSRLLPPQCPVPFACKPFRKGGTLFELMDLISVSKDGAIVVSDVGSEIDRCSADPWEQISRIPTLMSWGLLPEPPAR